MFYGDVWISQCSVWKCVDKSVCFVVMCGYVSVLCGDVWISQCVVWRCMDKSVCCVEVCG